MTSLGIHLFQDGEDQEAASWLERARKLSPDAIEVLELEASLERDPKRKREVYEAILKKDPTHQVAKQNLALPLSPEPVRIQIGGVFPVKKLLLVLCSVLSVSTALLSQRVVAQVEQPPSCTQRCAEESVSCIDSCKAEGGSGESCTSTCRQKVAACIAACR